MKTLRELSGLFTHYANCNQLREALARPIDALLAYPEESSLWVRCGDSELRRSFWNMVGFLRQTLDKRDGHSKMSEWPLLGFPDGPIRMSGPAIRGRVLWFYGDAMLTRASRINWSKREFICCPTSDLLDPSAPRRQQGIIIADIALLSIIISIAVWGTPGEGIVHIAVTENMNAMSRMNKKRAKRGIALGILEAFLARAILSRMEIVIAYSRTHQNVKADAITRDMVEQIETWAPEQGFTLVEIPAI